MFQPYNGWPNKPTWATYTVLTSYYETTKDLEDLVGSCDNQPEAIEAFTNWLKKAMGSWFVGLRFKHTEALDCLMKDLVGASADYVNWVRVHDGLRNGTPLLVTPAQSQDQDQDTLDGVTYALLSQVDWQAPLQGKEYLVERDEALRDLLVEQLYNWIEIPQFRTKQGPLLTYVRTAFNIWMKAIDLQKVVMALRGGEAFLEIAEKKEEEGQ